MSDQIERGVHRGSRRITLGVLLLAALAASCSDTDPAASTHPTAFRSSTSAPAVTFRTTSTTVIAQPVTGYFCSTVSPYFVAITAIVNPNGRTGVVITSIQLQFTDTTQRTLPTTTITLPGPVPITQFGDALDASRNALAFPVSLGIGCG